MTSTPDPVSLLQRLSANRGAGKPVPDDLANAALAWLADAAPAILSGKPVAAALGLRVAPGARSLSHVYRQSARDQALTRLYSLATGSRLDRGERVLGWIDAYQSGDPVPDGAVQYLDQVRDAGLRVPGDGGSVARIARARAGLAPVSPGDDDCGSIDPEAPPIAATSIRP